MTSTTSTGALWLDAVMMGVAALILPIMAGVALVTHPGAGLDRVMTTVVLWLTLIGLGVVAAGALLGRRTRWKVPDPKSRRLG